MKKSLVSIVIAVFMMQACSTVVKGVRQDVAITTDPPGATARIGDQECISPCTLNVPRKSDMVYVQKGNKVNSAKLDKGLNAVPLFLGNILWLLPGLAVDFLAGGAYTIRPVTISLNDAEASTAEASPVKGLPKEAVPAAAVAEKKLKENAIKLGDSFAVLPFVVLSSESKFNQLSQGFAENLTYHLVKSQAVKVIERTQMDKALQEMRLSMVGVVDNTTAQAIGKFLGAKYVVIGSVEIFGEHVEINCRVLQVQTSENILVEKESGDMNDMFSLRDKLGKQISQQIAGSVKR